MFQKTARSLAAGALLAVAAATPSFADIKLKISGQHATDHPATLALKKVEKAIEEADVGLEAKVFPSNQLGDDTLVHEDIIRGNVDIAHPSARINRLHLNETLGPTMILIAGAWLPALMITTYVPSVALGLPNFLLGN